MSLVVDTEGSVHEKHGEYNIFRQLAVKVFADHIDDAQYYKWLDEVPLELKSRFPSVEFKERDWVRASPPLNTAVYYDTPAYDILPTGALLRTSCSRLTHAFCAFKMPEDATGNRLDRRHVFEGEEKSTIQNDPSGHAAVSIVKNLITRRDVDQPGTFLKLATGISPDDLSPALVLKGHRSTFYVLIDGYDVLRCSIDRSSVFDFRSGSDAEEPANWKSFREVELSLYPRISDEIKGDLRVVQVIEALRDSLINRFDTHVIYDIKYQRGMKLLGKY
ncbi:hypothetical protein [Candidatus Pantoea floridensis]|uniref:Uncharacterized protein n=1 Tax=Candidatus Pantoea floridensis TaxID=1938870 RepID=A0A286DSS7_9GAMM|nr:hypothetical protein [Pantoea floridensis]PIF06757.1 hypothetical protein BX596_5248 [Enterobacteriaceae bacterium JKS000233]SOD61695.1 hypothetical protein SAMN06273570_5253 [Pantoea floridensis]